MQKPPADPVRRKKRAMAIKELTEHMRVCSKYLEDYLQTGEGSLKKIAVPSQNLPQRSHEAVKSSPQKRKSADNADGADRAKKRAVWTWVQTAKMDWDEQNLLISDSTGKD